MASALVPMASALVPMASALVPRAWALVPREWALVSREWALVPKEWALVVTVGALLATALLAAALLATRVRVGLSRALARQRTIAFLHPYCNDGGGGERVLWVAIRDIVARRVLEPARWRIVVYTGDTVGAEEIRRHAAERFGIVLPDNIQFIRLSLRVSIEAKYYPIATLLGQGVGSMLLVAEAIWRAPPDVLVDTTGLGFSYPFVRAVGVRRIAAYVHYPIVSADMLNAVRSRRFAHNNARFIARSAVGTALKLVYYQLLTAAYSLSGRCALVVMANGSWTADHLTRLWGCSPAIVFPPCDTAALEALPIEPEGGRKAQVLSLAQFRPEKDHALQLRAFAQLLRRFETIDALGPPRPHLVVAGAVRHATDQALFDRLVEMARGLGLDPHDVTFAPNLSLEAVRKLLATSSVGLHTMWNEHFGISVVEMMAAGLAVVAHDSGGPAMDIIGRDKDKGLLASTESEYCEAMEELLLRKGSQIRCKAMAITARQSVQNRFSERAFSEAFSTQLSALLE